MEPEGYMRLAIGEAYLSYREGNNGYGCIIVKNDRVIASSHEKSVAEANSLSHAVFNTLRQACKALDSSDLSGCQLYSTHEPCVMCASAIAISGIDLVAYGYLNKQSLYRGRMLILLTCREVLGRSKSNVEVREGLLGKECTLLYREDVRNEIGRLRGADERKLQEINKDSIQRRYQWFYENRDRLPLGSGDLLYDAYLLLLERMNIHERMAPILCKTDTRLVFRLKYFCPTLEACKILGLDPKHICHRVTEQSTEALVKLLDPRLRFRRNYSHMRPDFPDCEEIIEIES